MAVGGRTRADGHGRARACVACAYFPLSFSLFCVLNFNEAAATRRAKLLRALLRKTAAVGRKGEGEEGEGRRAGLWYCTAAEYQKSPNLIKIAPQVDVLQLSEMGAMYRVLSNLYLEDEGNSLHKIKTRSEIPLVSLS